MTNKLEAMKRIRSELQDLIKNPIDSCGVKVEKFDPNNIFKWKISFNGPSDTPYEGGVFHMTVDFQEDYPNSMPEVKTLTEMYHCNIGTTTNNSHGRVCYGQKQSWDPQTSNMRKVIWDILSLIYKPNPDDNMNTEASNLYISNRTAYENRVREYVKRYAQN